MKKKKQRIINFLLIMVFKCKERQIKKYLHYKKGSQNLEKSGKKI